MPTVRDAPWQSQLTPKPAHCPHAACRFSSARRGCSTCGRLLVEQRRGGPRRCSRRRSRRLAQPPPVRSASVVKQRDVCSCRWPHARGARHGQGRHSAGAMPEPRRASKRARRACRGMPEPAWWSPDAGYVQGRLRGALVPRPRPREVWGDRQTTRENREHRAKAVHSKVVSLSYYTDRITPMPGPFGLCARTPPKYGL